MLFPILIAVFVGYVFMEMYWKRRKYPPGPIPLPVIGNSLSFVFCKQPGYELLQSFKKKYGNVYTFWMGSEPFVMISDYDVIKESIIKEGEKYENRFNQEKLAKELRGGIYGIIESNGDMWRDHRRFALHELRNLGFAGSKMEKMVLAQVDEMAEKCNNGSPSLEPLIQQTVGSLINYLICGENINENNREDVQKMVAMIKRQSVEMADPLLILFISRDWMMKLPYARRKLQVALDLRDSIFEFFEKQIAQHKLENNDEDDTIDYVDAYLKEQKKREAEGDTETFSMTQLKNVCLDLWLAGFETTTATLMWCFIYVINHPEVQTKMREEMRTLVNSSESIKMAHRPSLPYCNAVVMECQRFLNLLPINLARRSNQETVIDGHVVPAGTVIVPLISMVLYDEKHFPEHDKFNPERFLDEEGKLKKNDALIPFSAGKRECPGKSMALMELFLILTNIVNRFEISAEPIPSMDKTFLTLGKPTTFDLITKPCN